MDSPILRLMADILESRNSWDASDTYPRSLSDDFYYLPTSSTITGLNSLIFALTESPSTSCYIQPTQEAIQVTKQTSNVTGEGVGANRWAKQRFAC